jgi:hypothetical protein
MAFTDFSMLSCFFFASLRRYVLSKNAKMLNEKKAVTWALHWLTSVTLTRKQRLLRLKGSLSLLEFASKESFGAQRSLVVFAWHWKNLSFQVFFLCRKDRSWREHTWEEGERWWLKSKPIVAKHFQRLRRKRSDSSYLIIVSDGTLGRHGLDTERK